MFVYVLQGRITPLHHRASLPNISWVNTGEKGIMITSTLSRCKRRLTMGDKGGKKNKEKSQKQKEVKHVHDVQQQKDKQQKSPFDIKSR
jgi:hypothetical protein